MTYSVCENDNVIWQRSLGETRIWGAVEIPAPMLREIASWACSAFPLCNLNFSPPISFLLLPILIPIQSFLSDLLPFSLPFFESVAAILRKVHWSAVPRNQYKEREQRMG